MRRVIAAFVSLAVVLSSSWASATVRSGLEGGSQKGVAILAFGLLSLPVIGAREGAVGLGAGLGSPDNDGEARTFNLHGFASARWRGLGYDLVLLERHQKIGESGRFTLLPMFGGAVASGNIWEVRAMAGPQLGLYQATGDLIFGFAAGVRLSARVPLALASVDVLYTPILAEGEFYNQTDGILRLLIGPEWGVHPYLEGRVGVGPELSLYAPVGTVFHTEGGLGVAFTW